MRLNYTTNLEELFSQVKDLCFAFQTHLELSRKGRMTVDWIQRFQQFLLFPEFMKILLWALLINPWTLLAYLSSPWMKSNRCSVFIEMDFCISVISHHATSKGGLVALLQSKAIAVNCPSRKSSWLHAGTGHSCWSSAMFMGRSSLAVCFQAPPLAPGCMFFIFSLYQFLHKPSKGILTSFAVIAVHIKWIKPRESTSWID